MPYRLPGRPALPESPDVDENLLREHWSSRALLLSLVNAPILTAVLVSIKSGSGPREIDPSARVAIAIAMALWLVVLLVLRARHQRVLRAAVARMQQQTAQAPRLRISDEPPQRREGDVHEGESEEPPSRAKRRG